MSTRILIAFQDASGDVISTYCHMDGYPSHNGAILLNCWNSQILAEGLVNNGYLSSLFPTIKEINEARVNNDETDRHSGERAFVNNADPLFMEYLYLFKEGKWFLSESMTAKTPDGYSEATYYFSVFTPLIERTKKDNEIEDLLNEVKEAIK